MSDHFLMTASSNHYITLGLTIEASEEDVKKAYKKLAVKYHPDKTKDKKHHELFIKIQEAYETLKDPVKKREYDSKRQLHRGPLRQSPATSTYDTSRTSTFGFYQHFYSNYNNSGIYERQRRAQEEKKKRDEENLAAWAAKEAKARVSEQLRRDAENQLRKEKAKKEQKEKERKWDEELERMRESVLYNERKREAFRKEWERSFSNFTQTDLLDQQYLSQRRKNNGFNSRSLNSRENTNTNTFSSDKSSSANGKGNNPSNPIILDGDKAENNHRENVLDRKDTIKEGRRDSGSEYEEDFVSAENSVAEEQGKHKEKDEDKGKDEDKENGNRQHFRNVEELFSANMNIRSKPEPTKLSQKRLSFSPTRQKPGYAPQSFTRKESPPQTKTEDNKTPKRAKKSPEPPNSGIQNNYSDSFFFQDLKNNLGTNIEDVDLSEVLDTLPGELDRTRRFKDDGNVHLHTKKPKIFEYTNGFSKADTLHMPVNKNSVKGYSAPSDKSKRVLTMLDLHASPKIHSCIPPSPPLAILSSHINKDIWYNYVSLIRKYQLDFLNYKKHIVQYQLERSKKDDEHFEMINSSSSSFEVYLQCLERDAKVLYEYNELVRIFTDTMRVYKQNCNWVKMTGI